MWIYVSPTDVSSCYLHMPIGKVLIYRLLFVCVYVFVRLFACTVTDFFGEDKAI